MPNIGWYAHAERETNHSVAGPTRCSVHSSFGDVGIVSSIDGVMIVRPWQGSRQVGVA